jgi:hypothetical protein
MTNTCPICHDSLAHKLGAYLQEFDSLTLCDHRSMDDKLNCRSDVSQRNHVAALRNEGQTWVLSQR